MRLRYAVAIGIVCFFFATTFSVGFLNNPHFPANVIAGESSMGTWASGVLLVMCATISLIFAMRRGMFPWMIIALFFLALALDERFMIHEMLKADIIFYYGLNPSKPSLVAELPVIAGALAGFVIALILWYRLSNPGRILLLGAMILGIAAVVIDVFAIGVLWEDSLKVIAELMITIALLREV